MHTGLKPPPLLSPGPIPNDSTVTSVIRPPKLQTHLPISRSCFSTPHPLYSPQLNLELPTNTQHINNSLQPISQALKSPMKINFMPQKLSGYPQRRELPRAHVAATPRPGRHASSLPASAGGVIRRTTHPPSPIIVRFSLRIRIIIILFRLGYASLSVHAPTTRPAPVPVARRGALALGAVSRPG